MSAGATPHDDNSKTTAATAAASTKWQGGHVVSQNNRIFPGKINMKTEFSSQRREILLFLATSMAAHENLLCKTSTRHRKNSKQNGIVAIES